MVLPPGFIAPCLPTKVEQPPSGPLWVHEIRHDGYRLMVRRDGSRVRCFTRNGHDWADRFPAIVAAAHRIKAASFLIAGEAVIARDDGAPDFPALRSRRRGHEAVLYAFELIEHDGDTRRAFESLLGHRPRAFTIAAIGAELPGSLIIVGLFCPPQQAMGDLFERRASRCCARAGLLRLWCLGFCVSGVPD